MPADRWRRDRLAAAACLLLTATGCTTENRSGRPETNAASPAPVQSGSQSPLLPPLPEDGQRLSCADSVATVAAPDDSYRVVAGAAAVSSELLQPSASSDEAGPTRLFAKWGLHVRAGAAVEVQVASGWEDRARIGWGAGAEPVTTVQVEACPAAGSSSAWSVFTGGTWVAVPGCVPLTIRSQGREAVTRLSVGAVCEQSAS